MKKTLFFIAFLLSSFCLAFAQEGVVFSSGTNIRGKLQKVNDPDGEGQSVWAVVCSPQDVPVVFCNPLTDDPYYATEQVFLYAQEGGLIEVEGAVFLEDESYYIYPTRISSYNATIEGKVQMTANPAYTIPTMPGVVFCVQTEDQQQFIVVDHCGRYSFVEGVPDPEVDIAGQMYPMLADVKVEGTVSQRWDLSRNVYLDIFPVYSYPMSIKPLAKAEEIQVSCQNGRVDIQSNSPISEVVVYDLEGKNMFKKNMTSGVSSYSFDPGLSGVVIVVVETENARLAKKLNIFQ